MIRVCILTTRFPPDYGGGARLTLWLCHKLAQLGVELSVITGHAKPYRETGEMEGIPVTRIPHPDGSDRSLLRFYTSLLRLLISRRKTYDILHANAIHHHSYAGFLAGRLLGKPTIAKIALLGHDDPLSIAKRRYAGLQLKMLQQGNTLVAVSREIAQAVGDSGWPSSRLAHIPNGVDGRYFCPATSACREEARRKLGIEEDAVVAVFVGIVVFRKGIHTLLKAWQRVSSNCTNATLLIVGPHAKEHHWGIDERYVASTRKLVSADENLKKSVQFVGEAADPKPFLHAADLFVFPSRGEGMPNALLEAMSCGLPFVATRLGVIEELAPAEQQDFLVLPDDVQMLGEKMIALANDSELRRRLGGASRARVQEKYSLSAVAGQYIELYRRLLQSDSDLSSRSPIPRQE